MTDRLQRIKFPLTWLKKPSRKETRIKIRVLSIFENPKMQKTYRQTRKQLKKLQERLFEGIKQFEEYLSSK